MFDTSTCLKNENVSNRTLNYFLFLFSSYFDLCNKNLFLCSSNIIDFLTICKNPFRIRKANAAFTVSRNFSVSNKVVSRQNIWTVLRTPCNYYKRSTFAMIRSRLHFLMISINLHRERQFSPSLDYLGKYKGHETNRPGPRLRPTRSRDRN